MTQPALHTIWVRWSFIGFHQYPTAPKVVSYLASPHRHTFNVLAELQVDPLVDRDIEFHTVKQALQAEFIRMVDDQDTGSCEAQCIILRSIIDHFYPGRFVSCTVDEDGECGSRITIQNI